jgi:hypothetical protein
VLRFLAAVLCSQGRAEAVAAWHRPSPVFWIPAKCHRQAVASARWALPVRRRPRVLRQRFAILSRSVRSVTGADLSPTLHQARHIPSRNVDN